ncbi:MAG TPA: hypothetical protein DGT23_32870 [Micromonosporaceae bacterium]|nr:hypothetical protein [Micromonosporaceae bacterium]
MNDFDFFIGKWNVANRRQDKWLVDSTNFAEFPGYSQCTRHFDGGANFDEIHFPDRGYSGLTLRLYDPEREEWTIYWANSRTGRLDPPMVGRFADGVGTFYGDDTYEGRPIKLKFIWSHITPSSARWQQELSDDDGVTWELNWVMDFTRAE